MEIHQALTRSETISNILCRHEQVRHSGCKCTTISSSSSRCWWHPGREQSPCNSGAVKLVAYADADDVGGQV
jgi:hypothetical protein